MTTFPNLTIQRCGGEFCTPKRFRVTSKFPLAPRNVQIFGNSKFRLTTARLKRLQTRKIADTKPPHARNERQHKNRRRPPRPRIRQKPPRNHRIRQIAGISYLSLFRFLALIPSFFLFLCLSVTHSFILSFYLCFSFLLSFFILLSFSRSFCLSLLLSLSLSLFPPRMEAPPPQTGFGNPGAPDVIHLFLQWPDFFGRGNDYNLQSQKEWEWRKENPVYIKSGRYREDHS